VGSGTLGWTQVAAWRSSRHHLNRRVPKRRLIQAVSELCGLHAQVMSSAELALWARVEGLRAGDLRTALWTDRSLVKIWAMRGTLHVLPAAEHPLWQAALSTYAHYRRQSWARYFGISSTEIDELIATIGDALDGRELTRDELADAVAKRRRSKKFGEALRESWGGVLKPASYQGVLCFAPGEPPRVRFTNPRSWLGLDGAAPDPEEALREVVRRFLTTYGPVSREELARWWAGGGLSPAKAERLIRSLGDEVTAMRVEKTDTWAMTADAHRIAQAEPARAVRLLPAFDQYVIGSTKHAVDLMPGAFRDRVHRAAGWVSPVLAIDGRIEGVWSHERARGRVAISIEPFAKQPAWVRTAAEAEAERLAAFLESAAEISWSAP
jgi:hypothetical protein